MKFVENCILFYLTAKSNYNFFQYYSKRVIHLFLYFQVISLVKKNTLEILTK